MSIRATLIMVAVIVVVIVAIVLIYRTYYRSRARRYGYPTRSAYLQAVPGNDSEKRDAVDQAFMGLVICLLGIMFPPLLLVGMFPLFIGGRKTVYALMGVGLFDEAEHPDA